MSGRYTLTFAAGPATAPTVDLTPYAPKANPTLSGTVTVQAAAGATPVLAADAPDADVGLRLVAKGTGAVRVQSGSLVLFQTGATGGTPANYWRFDARPTGNSLLQYALGTDTDVSQIFVTKGAGFHGFATATNPGTLQFQVAHTAGAVNNLQATGAATGGAPTLSAQGADANVPVRLANKGTAVTQFTGQTTGTAVGAAGAAAAPPAAPAAWWSVSVNGTTYRIPLYN